MKTKLVLLLVVLALALVPVRAQQFSKDCYQATQQCEGNRVAYILGCMATGGSYATCSMAAQAYYLECLGATGCYSEEEMRELSQR